MFASPTLDIGLTASWLALGFLTFVALSFVLITQDYRKHMRQHLLQGLSLMLLCTVGGLLSFVLFIFAFSCKACMQEFLYFIGAIEYKPTTRQPSPDFALREFV